ISPSPTHSLSLHDALPIYAGVAPLLGLTAGLPQHPVLERDDQAVLFGHRNELGWRDQAALRMAPAREGFDANDPSGSNVDLRLRSEEHTSELQSRFDLVCR